MFERFGGLGFVLYFLITGGLSLAVVNVSAHIAESTFQGLTIKKSETSQSSRVKSGLEAQERAARWKPAGYVLDRPPAPDLAAAALAKGLDTAESHPLPPVTKVDVWANQPRVAGWMKRTKARGVADENTGRIILRSLRSEM